MIRFKNASAAAALLASASMAVTPAFAADLPAPVAKPDFAQMPVWDDDSVTADHHRYRHRHRGYRHRGYRNRTSVGDVLAGVLIIGGIAAAASAAGNNRDRNRNYRDRDYRPDDVSGLERAANMCVSAIERDARVEAVDGVDRTARGWRVAGTLFDGQSFTCSIDNSGRIDSIDYGQRGASADSIRYSGEDRQYGADRYASAWAGVDGGSNQSTPVYETAEPSSPQPAYPGGPIDSEISNGDDRYQTGDTGDFGG